MLGPFDKLLTAAVRAQEGSGRHAELARGVVLWLILARLLADADHDGPPHAPRRPPRDPPKVRTRLPHRDSLAGRRPRG